VTLPDPFPSIDTSDDYNPAIRLFGNRLISEQTILEYTAEFLAVAFSEKEIASEKTWDTLPSIENLQLWPSNQPLKYKPPIKLNLKLFAFFGLSRIDGKHEVHEQHYRHLIKKLENSMTFNRGNSDQVLAYLDDFLQGFQGAGFNRAWCAQTFYPVSPGLLTQETIWNETKANAPSTKPATWYYALENFAKYFSRTKRNFMARGGEVLYLQLCNVFRMDKDTRQLWADKFEFTGEERDLEELHSQINSGFQTLKGRYTSPLEQFVDFLEALDGITHEKTNDHKYWLEGGWCPEESWPEGYLFAVELKRLFAAILDPIERLDLLITGCAMQVLRTICAQSIRYGGSETISETPLGYEWILSSSGSSMQQRQTSQRSLQYIQGIIQKALREDELQANAGTNPRKSKQALYKEADTKYGFKLLLSLGKKLGIIVPHTGRGAHFIMTDKLMRYLVIALLKPGERITYQDFLHRMYLHYGLAIEGIQLANAMQWSELPANNAMQESKRSWLAEMLRAGGFLTELSDAWSVVRNPFDAS
jgi:hypothetical protein